MADKQPDYTCSVNIDGKEYCIHCPREYIDQKIRLMEQLIDAWTQCSMQCKITTK